jgi:hypothetical protein
MNKSILPSLFLMGVLVLVIPLTTGAVGQKDREEQARNPDQNTHQQRNTYEGQQQQQFSNGGYTYEETSDRNWLEEQLQKHNNQRMVYDRSSGEDYAYEETVDRDWLTEHNVD